MLSNKIATISRIAVRQASTGNKIGTTVAGLAGASFAAYAVFCPHSFLNAGKEN
ncbi:unnamed protein product [Oikopleura dioica]|uniref:Uncharacterized protein n=1 Tax=Oikopleura dioica TaxID=34765 RepID=E4Y5K0_OIKDI|nr:unnamed protein product [Oikopleura dioica]CBY43347.1 unnamed protein product [Oikopleura dioica]